MMADPKTQTDRALDLLQIKGMVRLSEFIEVGITAATISRMKNKGQIVQLSRGLYQLPDAMFDVNHSLAEAAKLVPKGVICLVSALAYHELTDTLPSRIWVALGPREWRPRVTHPPMQFVRFRDRMLVDGIDERQIEGVKVHIYNPAKTVVDLFRYRQTAGPRYQKSTGLNLALEGLRAALRQRKATPAEIARYAEQAKIWKVVAPYLEAMTANV